MQHNKKLSTHICVLTSTTSHTMAYSDECAKIKLVCTFYGEEFEVWISKKNIEEDNNSIESSGPSELFDSFNEQMEENHWESLKKIWHEHADEHNKAHGIIVV